LLSEITSLFGLSKYLDRPFAQRIGSAKVKSKSEVTQCTVYRYSQGGATIISGHHHLTRTIYY